MATNTRNTNTRNTNTRNTNTRKAPQLSHGYSMDVTRVFDGQYGILFDVCINGVMIYGAKVQETQQGEAFVSWPARQGKDGRWYAYARPAEWSDADAAELLNIVRDQLEGDK